MRYSFIGLVAVLVGLFTVNLDAAGPVITTSDAVLSAWLLGASLFVVGAVLAVTHPTLLDFAQALGPDNKVTRIIEMMNQTNEMLHDAVAVEGNLLTGHQTTMRTGIPEPTFRKLYGGVQPVKSTNVKVTDTTAMLEAYNEVDKALADLNGNTAGFRLSESRPTIEGFNQKISRYLLYGSEATEPEAFTGFAPRFNNLLTANGENIIDALGTGSDLTSIWLIVWGENAGAHLIFPQGSQVGLKMTDKGQVTIENVDGSGGRMEAYRTHFRWDVGLTVRDWGYIVRIANIDISDMVPTAATGANITDLMTQALELVKDLNMGRPAFYVGRSVRSMLRRQMVNYVKNSTLTMENIAGKHVMFFDGVPVRRSDQLLNTETRVTTTS